MAERKRTNGEAMPQQIPEMPQEMGAMFGLLGMMQEVHEAHAGIVAVQEGIGALIALQEKIIKLLEQPKPPTTPVASTAQMYPGLRTTPAEEVEKAKDPEVAAPVSRRPVGWWGRLFPTRETHE